MNREPYYNWQWKVLLVNGMCLQTKDIYQKDGSFFKPSRPKMMTRGWLWLPKLKRKSKGLNFAVHIYTHTTSQARYLCSSALPTVNWKFHKIVHSGEFQIQLSVTQLELNSFSFSLFCTFFNFPTWLCVWSSSNAKKKLPRYFQVGFMWQVLLYDFLWRCVKVIGFGVHIFLPFLEIVRYCFFSDA